MKRRVKDIYGNYIGDAIGFCHFEKHPGALNHRIAIHKKCKGKRCKYLEKTVNEAWEKQKYRNRSL